MIRISHGFRWCQLSRFIAESKYPYFSKKVAWFEILIVGYLLWYKNLSFISLSIGQPLYIGVAHWSEKFLSVYILLCNLHICIISGAGTICATIVTACGFNHKIYRFFSLGYCGLVWATYNTWFHCFCRLAEETYTRP